MTSLTQFDYGALNMVTCLLKVPNYAPMLLGPMCTIVCAVDSP